MNVVDTVKNNNTRILELLLAVPGSVRHDDLDKALFCALYSGSSHAQCLRLLLESGASANAENSSRTALVLAVEKGFTDMTRLLVDAGATLDAGHGQRGTALHCAALYNSAECAKVLLSAGAFPNSRDNSSNTPLIVAAQNKSTLVMKELIKAKCDLNLTDSFGRTALHYACHKAVGAEMLLRAGADPDVQDKDSNGPIHMAATEGFDAVVRCLLEAGANADLTNCFNKTALHYLAMKNHDEGIVEIIKHGGDLHLTDSDGNTALWYAVFRNRTDAVKALLLANCCPDPGKDVNGTWLGSNPLQTALEKRLFDVAKLLILAGCQLYPLYAWIEQMEKQQERAQQDRSRFFLDSDEEDEEEEDEELESAMQWFQEWLHKPHSLQQLCRMAVRYHIGPGLLVKQHCLSLPQAMVDYVTLREVEDHPVVAVLI